MNAFSDEMLKCRKWSFFCDMDKQNILYQSIKHATKAYEAKPPLFTWERKKVMFW